ncbi:MAG: dephospho-CoA kinase [Planctomycetota bacterium]
MEVIGLAGGVASGKSTVAGLFAELGAVPLDADRIGHAVLLEAEVKTALRNEFGPAIFAPSGEVDRKQLAGMVFGMDAASRQRLQKLEAISHPRISHRLANELERLRRAGAVACVLDAAVMFKAGWDRFCTRIVFIRVPREIRLARASQRGWAPNELDARESNQTPLEEKERRATDFIDNSTHDLSDLRRQVTRLWLDWGLPQEKSRNFSNSGNS